MCCVSIAFRVFPVVSMSDICRNDALCVMCVCQHQHSTVNVSISLHIHSHRFCATSLREDNDKRTGCQCHTSTGMREWKSPGSDLVKYLSSSSLTCRANKPYKWNENCAWARQRLGLHYQYFRVRELCPIFTVSGRTYPIENWTSHTQTFICFYFCLPDVIGTFTADVEMWECGWRIDKRANEIPTKK